MRPVRILVATVTLMLGAALTFTVLDSDSSDAKPEPTSSSAPCRQPLLTGPAVPCIN